MSEKGVLKSKTWWTSIVSQGVWAALAWAAVNEPAIRDGISQVLPAPWGALASGVVILVVGWINTHFRNKGVDSRTRVKGVWK
jgi:hypothetical protein